MTNIASVTLRAAPPAAAPGQRAAPELFHLPEDAASGDEARAVATTSVEPTVLGAMLAAEALEHRQASDSRARRYGQAMMAALGELQRLLLAGGDPTALLTRLATLIADMPQAADPGLVAILGMIELRARVELARRAR